MRRPKGLDGKTVVTPAENVEASSTDVTRIPPAQLLFVTPPNATIRKK
jgi:hypothetical protein